MPTIAILHLSFQKHSHQTFVHLLCVMLLIALTSSNGYKFRSVMHGPFLASFFKVGVDDPEDFEMHIRNGHCQLYTRKHHKLGKVSPSVVHKCGSDYLCVTRCLDTYPEKYRVQNIGDYKMTSVSLLRWHCRVVKRLVQTRLRHTAKLIFTRVPLVWQRWIAVYFTGVYRERDN